MTRCSRHWARPEITASRDSRVPCMKNMMAMASVVSQPKMTAPSPWQGRNEAMTTVATMERVKPSGRNSMRRCMAGILAASG